MNKPMTTTATATSEARYFSERGLRATAPEALNDALRLALDSMSTTLFGATAASELTEAEQAALHGVGLDLEDRPNADPLANTAAEFAALIESSLTTSEVGKRLGFGAGRVRQMVADHSLYSILLEGRRYVPIFQFLNPKATRLVPNIGLVNRTLDPSLHPVAVFHWYTHPNPDLYLNDDADVTVSPLDWLKAGYPVASVTKLAALL